MNAQTDQERLEHAVALRAGLEENSIDSSTELEQWLLEDPRNAQAWNQIQVPWRLLGEQATAPALIELRRAALADAHEFERSQRQGWRMGKPSVVATAAMVVLVAFGALLLWQASGTQVYRTGPGERRVVSLIDGSEIALDSQSEVRVRYGSHARELALLRGQARFKVAHDVTRPFSVVARGQEVVATGTAFNVDLLGADLLVTLIEGHVVVVPERDGIPSQGAPLDAASARRNGADTRMPIRLDAGEQLIVSPKAAPRVTRVNTDRATAWEAGELVFDNEPLSSVVARVSRYGSQPIVIRDEKTSVMRISGVFHEGDVDGFVSTIVSYLPLSAQHDRDGSIEIGERTPNEDSR